MQKSSALLMAILITGFISIVSLSVSRNSFAGVRMSRASFESIQAFYAAEAGLEHALLKLRYNRDFEININANLPPFLRYFLTNQVNGTVLFSDPYKNKIPEAADSGDKYYYPFYDLKISYQRPYVGCDVDTEGTDNGVISIKDLANPNYTNPDFCPEKDRYRSKAPVSYLTLQPNELSVGYDVSNFTPASGNDIFLYWKLQDGSEWPNNDFNIGLQLELRGEKQGTPQQPLTLFSNPQTDTSIVKYSYNVYGVKVLSYFNSRYPQSQISNWTKKYLYIRPINTSQSMSIVIGLQPQSLGKTIGGPITQIESIGYYRNTKRKIWAEIDRKSGELSGIFDFVVGGGSVLIK